MKSGHLIWGQNSLSVQQHCLLPPTALAPDGAAPGKALLGRTPVSSLPLCSGALSRARTAPGTADTHPELLLVQIQTINRTICALWLSLLAAVHPIPGLVLSSVPPHCSLWERGWHGQQSSRERNTVFEPLGRITNPDEHKK